MPRVAPDANDVAVWRLSETGTTFANTGTLGATGDLTMSGSTGLVTAAPGPFGNALTVIGSTSDKTCLISTNPCPSGLEPAFPITLSGWIKLSKNLAGNSSYCGISPIKIYRTDGSWSTPWGTGGIQINTSGFVEFSITTAGGVRHIANPGSGFSFPYTRWAHLGLTYDGSVMLGYFNGEQVCSSSFSGAIDYGTSGPWSLGGLWPVGSVPAEAPPCVFADWRLANVARPLSYFQNVWNQGRLAIGESTGLTTYYRLQARDPACVTPDYARWTDTAVNLVNAPTGPCGTLGPSLVDLVVLRKWRQ